MRLTGAVVIAGGGTFIYVTSGFFFGFLPVFALAVVVAGLAFYEEQQDRQATG